MCPNCLWTYISCRFHRSFLLVSLDDYRFGNFVDNCVAFFILLIFLHALTNLVDGIVRLKGHKNLEINNDTFIYYGRLFGRVTFEIPLSEIDFVMKDWTTRMDDIERRRLYTLF